MKHKVLLIGSGFDIDLGHPTRYLQKNLIEMADAITCTIEGR